jgi:hypothetical protein
MMENDSVWQWQRTPYIHCIHLFDQSISTHFIHLFDRSKEGFWQIVPQCGGDGGDHVCAVERQRWWREEAGLEAVAEETDSSDVDGGGGDWWSREKQSRERRGLREFWDEKRNDTGPATICRFENISSGSYLEPLLIVLESGPNQFWFKTVADEGVISNSSS